MEIRKVNSSQHVWGHKRFDGPNGSVNIPEDINLLAHICLKTAVLLSGWLTGGISRKGELGSYIYMKIH